MASSISNVMRAASGRNVKINVYRHVSEGGAWCFALWIDGKCDTSGTLGVADDASEAEAMESARKMPIHVSGLHAAVQADAVVRVDDI